MNGTMTSARVLTALVCAVSLAVAACGDDSTAPAVERNDPGTGTQTMKVSADIDGEDAPGGFITDFDVQLRDAQDNPISGATVTIQNNELGTVPLLETSAGSGDYQASRNTFAPGDYRLDVSKGADQVTGVIVGGMSVHDIMSPSSGDTLVVNAPLTVSWTRPSQAAGVDVETQDYVAEGIRDDGTLTIAGEFLTARTDERVRVTRFNQVNIAGGLFGSRLKLSIRNAVEPLVVE